MPTQEGIEGLVVTVEGGGDQRLVGESGDDGPTLVRLVGAGADTAGRHG